MNDIKKITLMVAGLMLFSFGSALISSTLPQETMTSLKEHPFLVFLIFGTGAFSFIFTEAHMLGFFEEDKKEAQDK